MGKGLKISRRMILILLAFFVSVELVFLLFLFTPALKVRLGQGWKRLTVEGKRIIGWKTAGIPPEEKRIREEVILKKMEQMSSERDWRSLAPEYPRPKEFDSLPPKEKLKALTGSQEFKELEKEFIEYLKKKYVLLDREPPLPSAKNPVDSTQLKDKAAEKVIERLLNGKEKATPEKPLEENILLGIKGPLMTRKILRRPNPPAVKMKTEAEVELTVHVLPNGMVDRVIPVVKGDAELERIAIQYLRQWRFAPLAKDQPQVEQWGSVPIKFRLQ